MSEAQAPDIIGYIGKVLHCQLCGREILTGKFCELCKNESSKEVLENV